MAFADIDPYQFTTAQECDDALLFVSEECEKIEEDLRHPADEYTFGWLRGAKGALSFGKELKQVLLRRRADINAEIKHQRQCRVERRFMALCKQEMEKEKFLVLCAKAEASLTE